MKKRWKLLSPAQPMSLSQPAVFKWDRKHVITITRDKNNNWLTAQLNEAAPVQLDQNCFWSIGHIAKLLGVA